MKIISFLFSVYLVLFPFGQLTRLPVSFADRPEVHLYLTDILVGLLVIFWLIWRPFRKEKIKLPPLTKPILVFIFIAGTSLFFNTPLLSNREVIVSGLYLIRWIAYAGLYFVVFDLQKHFNQLKWKSICQFLLVIGIMIAIFGLIQYILWPNLRPLEILEWDPHFYRVVGTFLDPGFTGLILILTLILIVTLGWDEKDKRCLITVGLVVYLALTLTYSRSSYLAYLVSMGMIAWLKKAPRFFLAIFLLGLITLLVLPRPAGEGGKLGRTYSVVARIRNWQNALVIVRDHPLVGVGFNAYRYAQRDYGFLDKEKWQVSHAGAGTDSSLLLVLATTGIVGLLTYGWIWGKAIVVINKSNKLDKSYKIVVFASLIALLFHSFFLNSLFYPWIMAWKWMLLAKDYK